MKNKVIKLPLFDHLNQSLKNRCVAVRKKIEIKKKVISSKVKLDDLYRLNDQLFAIKHINFLPVNMLKHFHLILPTWTALPELLNNGNNLSIPPKLEFFLPMHLFQKPLVNRYIRMRRDFLWQTFFQDSLSREDYYRFPALRKL